MMLSRVFAHLKTVLSMGTSLHQNDIIISGRSSMSQNKHFESKIIFLVILLAKLACDVTKN